jgi:hypothetical protein
METDQLLFKLGFCLFDQIAVEHVGKTENTTIIFLILVPCRALFLFIFVPELGKIARRMSLISVFTAPNHSRACLNLNAI